MMMNSKEQPLESVEMLVKDANIYERVKNWAIPQLRGKINVSEEVFEDYVENFGEMPCM